MGVLPGVRFRFGADQKGRMTWGEQRRKDSEHFVCCELIPNPMPKVECVGGRGR